MSEKLTVEDVKRLYPDLVEELKKEHLKEYQKKMGGSLGEKARRNIKRMAGMLPTQKG